MSDRRLAYLFGPLERRGLLGAVGGGQATVLAAGSLAAILTLDHSPSAGGALAAMALMAASLCACFVPLGGRTTQEWATGRGRVCPAPPGSALALPLRRAAGRVTAPRPAREPATAAGPSVLRPTGAR